MHEALVHDRISDEARGDAIWKLWGREDTTREFRIVGGSMSSLIPDGTTVVVRFGRFGSNDLQVGDVVVRRQMARSVAHRIVRLRTDSEGIELTTKGDRALAFDPPIRLDEVLGKVVARRTSHADIDYTADGRVRLHRFIARLSYALGSVHVRVSRALRHARPVARTCRKEGDAKHGTR